jgi:hypothetical protein
MATSLSLMAHLSQRLIEQDRTERGTTAQTFLATTALSEVQAALAWLQAYGRNAPLDDLHREVERARIALGRTMRLVDT